MEKRIVQLKVAFRWRGLNSQAGRCGYLWIPRVPLFIAISLCLRDVEELVLEEKGWSARRPDGISSVCKITTMYGSGTARLMHEAENTASAT
jgi:hypothetical protein